MWVNEGWLRSVTGEPGEKRQRGRCGAVYLFLGPESWIVLSQLELQDLLNVRYGHLPGYCNAQNQCLL